MRDADALAVPEVTVTVCAPGVVFCGTMKDGFPPVGPTSVPAELVVPPAIARPSNSSE
jgi:hypothetical protein